jgi:hypothetical protein
MLDPKFVILAVLLQIYGLAEYAWSTLQGRTQPNRVTWLLWSIAPLIAFAAEITQGVGPQAWLTFIFGFGPAVVLAASFVDRRAYWKISRLDIICGALSLCAIALWIVTKSGNIAIAFSILADALAATPTIIKSYRFPATENASAFLYGVFSTIITLLTIKTWNFQTFGFPLYILLCDGLITILIMFPHLRFRKATA